MTAKEIDDDGTSGRQILGEPSGEPGRFRRPTRT